MSGQVLPSVGHTPPAGTGEVVLGDRGRRHRLALNHRLRMQFPIQQLQERESLLLGLCVSNASLIAADLPLQ